MSVCTPTAMAREAQRARAISSQSTAVVRTSAPAPPYFSSYSTPRKPSSPCAARSTWDLARLLPLLDVRLDLLLNEGAHRLAEHVVLLVEDLHALKSTLAYSLPSPPPAFTASRSTAPVGSARQGVGEHHHVRALEAGDPLAHEVAHCWAVGRDPPLISTTAFTASPQRGSGTP